MDSKKYIGYVESDIADTMWPSVLCRVARKLRPLNLPQTEVLTDRVDLTARHSFRWLEGLQKGQELIIGFVVARLGAIG